MKIQTLLVAATCALASAGCKKPATDPDPGSEKTASPSPAPPPTSTAKVAATPASPAGPAWKPLSSAEGRFTCLMIDGAKQEKQSTPTAAGTAEMVMWNATVPEGKAYSVAYADLPGVKKPINADKVLDGARDGAAKNINGKVASEKRITVGGKPGREIAIGIPDKGLTVWTRNILVDNRLYTLQGILSGAPQPTADPEVVRFFESFKLTK